MQEVLDYPYVSWGISRNLFEDFFPGYYKLNRFYWSVKHRTVDIYHKIDTGLEPAYYDIDTLLLHGCFSLLCRFVESEYKGADDLQKRIVDLNIWAEEEIERAKKEWTDKERLEEYIKGTREGHKREAEGYKEALRLYHWWKNIYPYYEENSPLSKHFDEIHPKDKPSFETKVYKVDKDGDPLLYELVRDNDPIREKLKTKIYKEEYEYDAKNEKEIEDNLISLIKLRKCLWTAGGYYEV